MIYLAEQNLNTIFDLLRDSGKLYTPELDIYGWRRRRRERRMHTTTWNNLTHTDTPNCALWCTKGSSSRQDQMEIDGEPTVSFARVILCESRSRSSPLHSGRCWWWWCVYGIFMAAPLAIVTTFWELNNKNNLAYHSSLAAGLAFKIYYYYYDGRKSMLCHFVMASSSQFAP